MRQRPRVPVRLLALVAGAALCVVSGAAAHDALDLAACVTRGSGATDIRLVNRAGASRYDFAWMADPDLAGKRPYTVHVADAESPRSMIAHDRLVLPGLPVDWIAAVRGADLVLCGRHMSAVIVIERQFCSGPLSMGEVANGEIEEITFLGGVSWLADDLAVQTEDGIPAELAEDLRQEVAMASPARHTRDPDAPHVVVYAPEVASLVARWSIVPMSRALGERPSAACEARHATLRARIMSANRLNR